MSTSERQKSSISLVVAAARNGVIGRNGEMPWRVPGDLKTFRRLTMGRPVIMGRKTFEAIGRALDGRTNIVVTRDPDFTAPGVVVVPSIEAALGCAAEAAGGDSVMVIGGGEIYRAFLPLADRVYLSRIAAKPDGDTHFPDLDPACWREVARTAIAPDPRDEFGAELIEYARIGP